MRWFVSKNGKSEGPFTSEQIVAAVKEGKLSKNDMVCGEGLDEWSSIGTIRELAAPAPVVNARRSVSWGVLSGSVAGVLFAGFVGWALWDLRAQAIRGTAELVQANEHAAALLAEARVLNALPRWSEPNKVINNCIATRSEVSCTFTNSDNVPVATCVKGQLTPKEAAGVTLRSLSLCSGRLMPAETRTVSAPWLGGFADDICYRESGYGKNLDWSKCNFDTNVSDMASALVAPGQEPTVAAAKPASGG